MTAILKDWKGFTSSLEVPAHQPYLRIPIYHRDIPAFELTDPLTDPRATVKMSTITFRFKEWLNKEYQVALYEQET